MSNISIFILTNTFIFQPSYPPPLSEKQQTFCIPSENAYLVQKEDGSYLLFADGMYQGIIEEFLIFEEPFSSLSIKSITERNNQP